MIVEVATHGSAIRRRRDRFVIDTRNPDGTRQQSEIPADKVDAIMVTANAMISTQAAKLCTEKQIQMVLASYGGRPYARMWSSTPGRATEIRRRQYLNLDTRMASDVSRYIVSGKLRGQRKVLLDLKNNRKESGKRDLLASLDDAIGAIRLIDKKMAAMSSEDPHFKQTLLGLEGSAASRYFSAVSACLPAKWQFSTRSQNPGLDPFNASLNYLYGMGYASVEKVIILSGLDPHAGFYHADSYGKPTLAFDLIEICRPLLDKTAIALFSRKIAQDSWFTTELSEDDDAGIKLTNAGRAALISGYKEDNVKSVERITWNLCRTLVGKLIGTSAGGFRP